MRHCSRLFFGPETLSRLFQRKINRYIEILSGKTFRLTDITNAISIKPLSRCKEVRMVGKINPKTRSLFFFKVCCSIVPSLEIPVQPKSFISVVLFLRTKFYANMLRLYKVKSKNSGTVVNTDFMIQTKVRMNCEAYGCLKGTSHVRENPCVFEYSNFLLDSDSLDKFKNKIQKVVYDF